jgi:hypothetical protein
VDDLVHVLARPADDVRDEVASGGA